ncbi:anti-phage dCTP deaminase [Gemmatimonadota bacterium]
MEFTEPLDLRLVEEPEIVIGLVGPLGSPMPRIIDLLKDALAGVGYSGEEIRLSRFLQYFDALPTQHPSDDDLPFLRWNALMSRGNELREGLKRGDALAMHAAAAIRSERPKVDPPMLQKRAFVLRQLKHPDEVRLLRQVYGDGFHLIAVYTPEDTRSEYLRNYIGLSPDQASELIERDAGEEIKYGQQVTKTFHHADLFVDVQGWDDKSLESAQSQIVRYVDLLFGRSIITPSSDEYGMYLAFSAALRSSDLSRQVGAAILGENGEVLALGTNEVPRAGGGQYWGGDHDDRDFVRGYDSNAKIKLECAEEVMYHLDPERWAGLSPTEREAELAAGVQALGQTRLMNLTEFGRAVHAEMEAILSAVRIGVCIRDQTLYTTTFPCHNCAKHIVGSGLKRVVYVEPYSKSLANRLHGDAIAFSIDELRPGRMPFEPFRGVAPRRFSVLFSMTSHDGTRVARKTPSGDVKTEPSGLRCSVTPLTHIDREAVVADYLDHLMEGLSQTENAEEEEV